MSIEVVESSVTTSLTMMGGRATPNFATGYDSSQPDFVTDSSRRMYDRSRECRQLMDGLPAIKRHITEYLPKYPNEDTDDYKMRWNFLSVRNFFAQAVTSLLGKMFAQPPRLNPDVPDTIRNHLDDADLNGADWTMVARDLARHAVVEGMAWIFVDYNAVPEDLLGQLTMADERDLGIRPYWFIVPASRFLGARYRKIGQVYVLLNVRFIQYVEVEDGDFGSKWVKEIYSYRSDYITVFRADDSSENAGEWKVHARYVNSLGRVPAVPLILDRIGRYEGKPPLENLAHMNKEHIQIRSDQRRALSVMSFPILATSGVEVADGQQTRIGPMRSIMLEDPHASVKWVESQGAHLRAGREELADLENAIRVFGLAFENPQAYATATGRSIDASDSVAPIQMWSLMLKDVVEVALQIHADWLNLPSGGTIDVNVSYLRNMITIEGLKLLVEALKEGAITPRGFLTRLKEYGILSEDFDVDKDIKEALKIAEEAQSRLVAVEAAKAAAKPKQENPNDTSSQPPAE